MPRTRRFPFVILGVLVILQACGGGASAASSATSTTPEPARAAVEPAAAADPRGTIRLLSPGTGTRRVLRYSFAEAESAFDAVFSLRFSLGIGDRPGQSMTSPGLRLRVVARRTDLRPDGSATFAISYPEGMRVADADRAALDPATLEQVESGMRPLVETTGTLVLSSRGLVQSVDLVTPPNAPEGFQTALENARKALADLVVSLPEEPLGMGARWEHTAPLEMSGVRGEQRSTFEITGFPDERSVDVRIVVTQTAEPQEVEAGDLPAGATLHLLELTSSGEGTSSIRLDRLASPANVTMNVAMRTELRSAEGPTPINNAMNMTIAIQPTR